MGENLSAWTPPPDSDFPVSHSAASTASREADLLHCSDRILLFGMICVVPHLIRVFCCIRGFFFPFAKEVLLGETKLECNPSSELHSPFISVFSQQADPAVPTNNGYC